MHPERFGHYRIVRKLPGGGMGRVYQAVHTANNQPAALKLIDIASDRESQEVVEAERTGAILQSRLCGLDSRVTQIQEYGELEGHFYIAMEFVEGDDLSVFVTKHKIGVPFAARIAADLCEVLDRAHNFRAEIEGRQYSGIVHGDIKPRNIRITTVGQVKVLDFGIAKALSMTRRFTSNQFGSVQYSSPERLLRGEVDAHTDLWSVGVVLYEMIVSRPYFQAVNVVKLEYGIKNYSEVQPLPPDIPSAMRSILSRALSPNPADRFQTAREMADSLNAYVAGKPIPEPVAVDMEATRRTTREAQTTAGSKAADTRRTIATLDPPAIDDATRRANTPLAAPPAPPVKKKSRPQDPSRARLFKLLLAGFVSVLVGYFFVHEIAMGRQASQLARELQSEQLRDMDAAWTRYQKLASESLLSMTVAAPREALKDRLLADADRVINGYRNSDAPNTSEADWMRAEASASHALALFPGDNGVRGRLRLAEGHLDRIRGAARKESKLLHSAREKFEQAAALMPKSPDPHLGLARLYAYSLRDVERTEEAIRTADRRGHEPGKREKAQLADVYRDRADRLYREAERAEGRPEELDYLERARRDYEKAREIYEEIVPFSGAIANIRKVLDGIELIERRKEDIKASR